jgi:hypothetical protein
MVDKVNGKEPSATFCLLSPSTCHPEGVKRPKDLFERSEKFLPLLLPVSPERRKDPSPEAQDDRLMKE